MKTTLIITALTLPMTAQAYTCEGMATKAAHVMKERQMSNNQHHSIDNELKNESINDATKLFHIALINNAYWYPATNEVGAMMDHFSNKVKEQCKRGLLK